MRAWPLCNFNPGHEGAASPTGRISKCYGDPDHSQYRGVLMDKHLQQAGSDTIQECKQFTEKQQTGCIPPEIFHPERHEARMVTCIVTSRFPYLAAIYSQSALSQTSLLLHSALKMKLVFCVK